MEPGTVWWRRLAMISFVNTEGSKVGGQTDRFPDRSVRAFSANPSCQTVPTIHSIQFDEFYAAHRNEIAASLAFTLGSDALGEEAADEAMARAYQKWDEVSGYGNPAGWVYRAGANWGRSWYRSRKRRRLREEFVSRDKARKSDDSQQSADLIELMKPLSFEHRTVVVLRFFNDWSVKETALALGISEGTVKSRTARALDQLRGALEEKQGSRR